MEKDVPYIVYESEAARHERTVKRLLVALLITILLMVGTNLAWLYVWNQYDFSSETYTVESDENGNSNVLQAGMNGEINNGK
jgi:Tfp pilus assembly protein PilW